ETAVDAIIDDIYQDRQAHTYTLIKTLYIGGTNAAPSAGACTRVSELRANFNWSIVCNGC
ncbi:MAG: hypothetical protein JRH20_07210, partial [Deltaproteobacteria bacterium]|nr:hypothetical protein [Deltaproteobacteria bacterium]